MKKQTKTTTTKKQTKKEVCPSCNKKQTPSLLHVRECDCGGLYGLMRWETLKCSKCGNVYVNRMKVKVEEEEK